MDSKTVEFVAMLQRAATVAKINHWNTHSFAQHIALDELQEALIEATDKIAEAVIGIFPDILNDLEPTDFEFTNDDAGKFIQELVDYMINYSEPVKDIAGALGTVIDDLSNSIYTAKYKIDRLK